MTSEKLFEIKTDLGKVWLKVKPSIGGRKADLDEIQEELHEIDADYLPEKLLEIYEKESNRFEHLCDLEQLEYQIMVDIAAKEFEAYITVIPPSGKTDILTVEHLDDALRSAGVIAGISKKRLQEIVDHHIVDEPLLVAKGRTPVNGKDGYVQLVFGEEYKNKALRVDHRETHFLKNAKAGDVLVNVVDPTPGKDGFTVKGEELRAVAGKKCHLYPGRNTKYNPDRTQIIATKSGFVVIIGHTISIENICQVKNVDANTGNIRFDGILHVRGNVEDGYVIETSGRIEILGSVGKSTLISKSDINVRQGIIGASIKSDRTVKAGFVSDANVEAGKDVVVSEYILNSDVSANEIVIVTGEEGFITGGNTHAGNFIKVNSVGSDKSELITNIDVGIDLNKRKKFHELEDSIEMNIVNFEKLKKNLILLQAAREKRGVLPSEHEKLFEEMAQALEIMVKKQNEETVKWRELMQSIKKDKDSGGGIFFVKGSAHSGTVVKVRRQVLTVRRGVSHAAFIYVSGKVHVRDFSDIFKLHRRHFSNYIN